MMLPQYNVVQIKLFPCPSQAERLELCAETSDALREWLMDNLINGVYQLHEDDYKKVLLNQVQKDWYSIEKFKLPGILVRCILLEIGYHWMISEQDADYMQMILDKYKGRVIVPFKAHHVQHGGVSIFINGLGRIRAENISEPIIYRVECYRSGDDWLAEVRTGSKH